MHPLRYILVGLYRLLLLGRYNEAPCLVKRLIESPVDRLEYDLLIRNVLRLEVATVTFIRDQDNWNAIYHRCPNVSILTVPGHFLDVPFDSQVMDLTVIIL